jgi:omega-6 fatty acid desaturase (delta-12 desaturase)
MFRSLEISYWLTLGLAVFAAGFLLRIFIIFHDCGHGAFFKSEKANEIVGRITGILTLAPYHQWRHDHAIHHATSGDLDRRGVGDIWTLTIDEYVNASSFEKISYRLYRSPIVMFGFGGLYLFLIRNRFPRKNATKAERRSVLWTNLSLAVVYIGLSLLIGVWNVLLIQIPIMMFSAAAGVWLFYIQHQFEGVYWEHHEEWDYFEAAMQGSSFYKLPRVLQWFSGNIGFHHVHHFSPRIPNYFLERCHKDSMAVLAIKPVTLWSSFKALRFRLWDEKNHNLVSFRILKKLQKQPVVATS